MRLALVAAFVAMAVFGFSQWETGLQQAVGSAMREREKAKPSTTTQPSQPAGRTLPPADPALSQRLEIIQLRDFEREGDEFRAEGDVRIIYRGYQIFGERVIGNLKTEIFRIEGGGRLLGKSEDVVGDVIEVNFKDETYMFREGKAIIQPDRLQNRLLDPLYVSGARGTGSERRQDFYDTDLTTCILSHPHYRLIARQTTVFPGRYAILRDVKLEILGRTVLRIPYLSVPLSENSRRYTPEVGQSRDEGYYIKSRFTTPLPGDDFIDTRLDYMTKLGLGTGFDYLYGNDSLSGKTSFYSVLGRDQTMFGQAQHRQRIGAGELSLDAHFNRNNYLTAPDVTTLNSRAQYVLPWGGGQSRLGYSLSTSDSGGFSSKFETINFGDNRQSGSLRTSLDVNLSSAQSKSNGVIGSESERLDLRFQGTQEMRSLTADLLYQRSIPVGSTSNFTPSSDRTPLLTLRSNAQRLFGPRTGRSLPFNTQFSIGQLADAGAPTPITRTTFEFDFRRNEGRTSKHQLNWGGRFLQGVYSDDTAQYVLAYDARYTYNFAANSSFNLNYRNLRQFGYTPLSIDRTGRSDAFGLDVSYRPNRQWLLSVQTGYDMLQALRSDSPWQSVSIRTEFAPGPDLRIQAFSVYDTFNRVWGNSRLDAQFRLAGADFAAGVRFDGRRSTWSAATLQMTGLKAGRFNISTLLAFNGYTRQLEAQHYSLTYDMHCTEAVLEFIDNRVGFRNGNQIAFFIRIKALPFSNPFGIGQRGQSVGTVGGFGN